MRGKAMQLSEWSCLSSHCNETFFRRSVAALRFLGHPSPIFLHALEGAPLAEHNSLCHILWFIFIMSGEQRDGNELRPPPSPP